MQYSSGNRISLLETGDQYFPALEAAIDGATRELHLETYIFLDDAVGRRIGEALARAARRGVAVRLLIDGIGSRRMSTALREMMTSAGVELLVYRPEPKRFSLCIRHLRRMHRKLAVIDGTLAFCGGINVTDDRNGLAGDSPRYDFAVQIEGDLVREVHRAARRLWILVRWTSLTPRKRSHMARGVPPSTVPEGCRAAFITRDNLRNRRGIEDAYLDAIRQSEREVLIASAYFLPGQRIRHALIDAARRKVRVRLLLQGRPDHLLLHQATHALYRNLLQEGIELWEYTAAHLHAKVAIVDQDWATIGSSNIDPFSLWLSREANVVVRDATLVNKLRASLESSLANCALKITRELAAPLPIGQRVATWVTYELGRLFLGLAGLTARDEL